MTLPLYQDIVAKLKSLTRRVERLETVETTSAGWVILPQASRLTSTAWDGDARSTTSATAIDMSAVFGTPANIDAVLLEVELRDDASSTTDCWIRFSDGTPLSSGSPMANASPVNNRWGRQMVIVPTDSGGDIYFDCRASGDGTLDVIVQVHGYHLR